MALRLAVVLLIMALVMVAESTTFHNVDWGMVDFASIRSSSRGVDGLLYPKQCNGKKVGDCIDVDEEMMTLDAETTHRVLAGRRRYVSYGAMRANSIPCNNRGASYYNCKKAKKANPYRRGCSAITRCRRRAN